MTPPSSVSPQDKLPSPFAARRRRRPGLQRIVARRLRPVQAPPCTCPPPHPPSSPRTPRSVATLGAAGGARRGTTPRPRPPYYAMSALGGGHSGHGGYADVNHNTTASYDQCARAGHPVGTRRCALVTAHVGGDGGGGRGWRAGMMWGGGDPFCERQRMSKLSQTCKLTANEWIA